MTAELMTRARAGDSDAFGQLVDRYRHEIQVHCYRILGSAQDADDALQETLLAAWQGLGGYQERASMRTWLYRIATSRCLNALRQASRRPRPDPRLATFDTPPPTRLGEVVWLEPYPDVLLEGFADGEPGPESRYDSSEAISLAFIVALQLLPPRQRAVLVLRDVLGFRASEVAEILDTSEGSVTSALKRARATLQRRRDEAGDHEPPPAPNSPVERALVDRLTRAYENGDLRGVIDLLCDDAWLAMPPVPFEYQGREVAARFLEAVAFQPGRSYRLVETRANGQPAFAAYARDPHAAIRHAVGLFVITLAGDRIAALTRFDNSVLARFGLPRTLSD